MPKKPSKILCIDDNTQGLAARRILLESEGYEVAIARNGRDGLEAFRKTKADVIILDYLMPQMNGGEVIREIRKSHPKIPIILLSAYAETMNLEEKVTEADCVLKKGAREVQELLHAINRLLRKSMKKPAASVKAKTPEKKTIRRKKSS